MAYAAPTIGQAGLTIPTYDDILTLLLGNFRSVYGQTVYLGNDSADFQFISSLSLALSDAMQALQLDYNNRSPNFAIGAALSSLVKINGLSRKPATFSTCDVTLSGDSGTAIVNGLVRDTNGVTWNLPASVTIGSGGSVVVTAVCSQLGAVNALVGQIVFIVTPSAGWDSVNNAVAASVGQPVETDSQLRTRQSESAELPSQTILAGTIAAIEATLNVTRLNVVENSTSIPDSLGNPPHSITAVVEGGTNQDVALAIYNNRGIGAFTNGTTIVPITDLITGIVTNIGFSRPGILVVSAIITLRALNSSYTSAVQSAIAAAVVDYLNSLEIGEDCAISALFAVSMNINTDIKNPSFAVQSIEIGINGVFSNQDLVVPFNKVTSSQASNIDIQVVP